MISARIEISRTPEGFLKRVPAAALEGVREGLDTLGQQLENRIKRAAPHRSGSLRRSIAYIVRDENGAPSLSVGAILAPPPYAGIRERGGTISPKNSRYLTIPIGKARTPSGADVRFTARQLMSSPESFGYESAFIRHGIIFGKLPGKKTTGGIGGRWNVEPLFKLVDRVKQQASNEGRGFIRTTVIEALDQGLHRKAIGAAVRRRLAEAQG